MAFHVCFHLFLSFPQLSSSASSGLNFARHFTFVTFVRLVTAPQAATTPNVASNGLLEALWPGGAFPCLAVKTRHFWKNSMRQHKTVARAVQGDKTWIGCRKRQMTSDIRSTKVGKISNLKLHFTDSQCGSSLFAETTDLDDPLRRVCVDRVRHAPPPSASSCYKGSHG